MDLELKPLEFYGEIKYIYWSYEDLASGQYTDLSKLYSIGDYVLWI